MSLDIPHPESWLAGVLDSEANFRSMGATYPLVQLGMNDADIMERVRQVVTHIVGAEQPELDPHQLASGSTHYRLVIVGDDAIKLMKHIRPMMSTRRTEQINTSLKEYE